MAMEKNIAKAFGLEGESWEKHTNPWSIWTRFATLPFLILAVWSRVWIGWYSLIPIVLLVIWLRINPTLFKKPNNYDHWGSKSVLGEKFWSERKTHPVPEHHQLPILILTCLQTMGGLLLIFGLWQFNILSVLTGAILTYMAKMWFLDRMVWIYQDMTHVEK